MCDRTSSNYHHMSRKKINYFAIIIALTLALCTCHQIALGAYAIHVSSYRSGENASVEASDLRAGGLDAFTRYESVPGKGMWHRVYIGNFASHGQAAATGKALKSRGVISYYSVKTVSRPVTAAAPAQTGQFDTLLPPPSETPPPNQAYPLPPPNNVNMPGQTPGRDPFAEIPPNIRNQLGGEESCPVPQEEIIYTTEDEGMGGGADKRGFTLGLRNGVTFWPNTDNFSVRDPSWQIHRIRKPQALNIQLVPTYRFNDVVALESTVEKEFGPGMDFTYLTIGPKFYLNVARTCRTLRPRRIILRPRGLEGTARQIEAGLGL